MRKLISLDEHKQIINRILIDIRDFCNENNIQYYLAFGTLLGAVRHGGFIPWDDDIDIVMTREEYNRFKSIYNLRKSKYKLLAYDLDDRFDTPLPKVIDTTTVLIQTEAIEKIPIGLYVDIFILDNIPDDKVTRKKYLTRLTQLQKCWSFIRYKREYPKSSPMFYLYRISQRIFKPIYFVKMLDKYSQKYNKIETKCFGHNSHCSNRLKYIYKKEWFQEGTEMLFEGNMFTVPKNWDAFLTCLFGDYMKLPPKDKQVSNHIFDAYYKSGVRE